MGDNNIKINDREVVDSEINGRKVTKMYVGDIKVWEKAEEEPAGPQSFVKNGVLPATEELKIAWTEEWISNWPSAGYPSEGANPLNEGRIYFKTTNDYFWLSRVTCDDFGSSRAGFVNDGIETDIYTSYDWTDNCGSSANASCETTKYVIYDTSDWSEAERTIKAVDDAADDVGLTYEDLNA